MHDVKIGNKYINKDYGMVLEKITIPLPTPRTQYVTVPGRDGILDYSEAVAGHITYDTRLITLTLVAEGESPQEIDAIKDAFIRDIHGKTVTLSPEWQEGYYEGRATVEVSDYRPNFVRLTIKVTAEPYRIAAEEVEVSETISGEAIVVLRNNGEAAVSPVITTDGEINISYDNWLYAVGAGSYTLPFVIRPGIEEEINVTGDAEITFTWRERFL